MSAVMEAFQTELAVLRAKLINDAYETSARVSASGGSRSVCLESTADALLLIAAELFLTANALSGHAALPDEFTRQANAAFFLTKMRPALQKGGLQ